MGYIINDWRCTEECGYFIADHLSENDGVRYLVCPECGKRMSKVPAFAKPPAEWPDYVQKDAIKTLDSESPQDREILAKAQRGQLRRDVWFKEMANRKMVYTDKSEMAEFRRKREKAKQGETPEQRQATLDKMLAAQQKNTAVSVGAK